MCGIVGYYNLDQAPACPDTIARMMRIQRHRGPDDNGLRLFSLKEGSSREVGPGTTGLDAAGVYEGAVGFNRLAILDLSKQGHQPMCNRYESIFITFNGEVYNAFDYRKELEATGYEFRSRTDTEVILHLYEHLGFEAMLDRLNGMFAVCIVDLNQRCMYLARDHFGIKPLYWSECGNTFLYSSEIKSFLEHPSFTPELDPGRVDEYLAFRYCANEGTLFRGVRQLQPGHMLRVSPEGIEEKQYWEIEDSPSEPCDRESDLVSQLEQRLADSVERQLISDVKLGCQLSGGIDSSLVTAYARQRCNADMETFSIVFQDPKYTEDHWISQAATATGVHSHRYMLSISDILESLETATWHLDQPLSLPNCLGIYLLAERSKELVTVLLSGEGADELMGGYGRYHDARLRERIAPYFGLLRHIPRVGNRLQTKFQMDRTPHDRIILSSVASTAADLRALRPEIDWDATLRPRREFIETISSTGLSAFLKYDMRTYMVDLLVRQDKMTMAHAMENRVPFLDRDLVTFVRGLADGRLVGNAMARNRGYSRNTKLLLKQLAERVFSTDFVYREKCGFPLPLDRFFQDPGFVSYMEDAIMPGIRSRGIFQADVVERWWRQLTHSDRKIGKKLWVAVAFEIWAQTYLDKRMPQSSHDSHNAHGRSTECFGQSSRSS